MRGIRQKEKNFQNREDYEDDCTESLIQPYHIAWASELANRNNLDDKFNHAVQNRYSNNENDSRSYEDQNYGEKSYSEINEVKKYPEQNVNRSHCDRDLKSYHRDDAYGNSRNKSYDRSPEDMNRRTENKHSPDSGRKSTDREKRSRWHKSKERSKRHSRSRSRERSRRHGRSHSRSRSRSRSRSKRSSRSRNRDRHHDDERSRYRSGRSDSYADRSPTYHEEPTSTIMLRGLAQHITQQDITVAVRECNLEVKQIRLIRKKYTGASRGFAFVEFNTIQDAQRWMDMKQVSKPKKHLRMTDPHLVDLQKTVVSAMNLLSMGSVMFHDQYRALMKYAVHRDVPSDTMGDYNEDQPESNFYPPRFLSDWNCTKCGAINFKRREACFKCLTSRQESALGLEGTDEISDVATKKIILRNLDILTKEETLRSELESRTPGLMPMIMSLEINKDGRTSLSRGVAYLHFNNTDDAKIAYDTLNKCEPPFTVENKTVMVSYCLEEGMKNMNGSYRSGRAAPKPASGTSFTVADVPKMAAYSAELYAQNAEQKQQYLMYYTNYYMQQIAEGISISMPQTQSDETNSAAAVAHQAIMKMQNKNRLNSALEQVHAGGASLIQVPNGIDGRVYSTPDISSYYYDQSSGYYYDAITGLYYDPNTQYYYNSHINKFLYWDNIQRTYILAPDGSTDQNQTQPTPNVEQNNSTNTNTQQNNTNVQQEGKPNKTDKVKVAKRIAKDMERWAKTLNQKKENSKRSVEVPNIDRLAAVTKSATADICFSMVEKSERNPLLKYDNPLSKFTTPMQSTESPLEILDVSKPKISHDEAPRKVSAEKGSIDFDKLACLICKRQFGSREMLIKHTKMSLLHKQNLAILAMQT